MLLFMFITVQSCWSTKNGPNTNFTLPLAGVRKVLKTLGLATIVKVGTSSRLAKLFLGRRTSSVIALPARSSCVMCVLGGNS